MERNSAATNAEMIAAVKAEFPESAFKETHAAWYRSQARRGLLTGKKGHHPDYQDPEGAAGAGGQVGGEELRLALDPSQGADIAGGNLRR